MLQIKQQLEIHLSHYTNDYAREILAYNMKYIQQLPQRQITAKIHKSYTLAKIRTKSKISVKTTVPIPISQTVDLQIMRIYWPYKGNFDQAAQRIFNIQLGYGLILYGLHYLSQHFTLMQIVCGLRIHKKSIKKALFQYFTNSYQYNNDFCSNLKLDSHAEYSQLNCFNKHFCNICLIFNCHLHTILHRGKVKRNTYRVKLSQILPSKPIVKIWYNCIDYDYINQPFIHSIQSYQCDSCIRGKYNIDTLTINQAMHLKRFLSAYNTLNPCFYARLLDTDKCSAIRQYIEYNKEDIEYMQKANTISISYNQVMPCKKDKATLNSSLLYSCYHKGACTKQNCSCINEYGYCEKHCSCKAYCNKIVKGCKCDKLCDTNSCRCKLSSRECSAECECKMCKNKEAQRPRKKLLLAKSTICDGYGLYAGQEFNKGDYICDYIGEKITYSEERKRNDMCIKEECTYVFQLDEEYSIDCLVAGNKMRYVNHTPSIYRNCNSEVELKIVDGTRKVLLYATKHIRKYEEILFDYYLEGADFKWVKDYASNYAYLKGASEIN